MWRRKAHALLAVLINNRLVGQLTKEANGASAFQYDESWLEWDPAFAVSLSLPPREAAYNGAPVVAVFVNLLPDNRGVQRRVPLTQVVQQGPPWRWSPTPVPTAMSVNSQTLTLSA